MNKICSKCNKSKPLDKFSKGNGKYFVHNWCKMCCLSYEQSDKRKEIMKKYRTTNDYKLFIERYRKSVKGIYAYIKGSAKVRNIQFSLTENIFINWYVKQIKTCVYCKRTAQIATKDKNGRIHRLTIDRKDNTKGYNINNMVLCCHKCNEIKGAIFSYEEMIKLGNVLETIYKEKYIKGL